MNKRIFENNIEILKRRWPEYIVDRELVNSNTDIFVRFEEFQGKIVPVVYKNEECFHLDSMYNSDRILDKWINYIFIDKFEINLFMFGLGNGSYVRKFLEKTKANKQARILVYEPDIIIFQECLKYFDMRDLIENEKFILFIPEYSSVSLEMEGFKYLNYSNVKDAQLSLHMNYAHIYPEQKAFFSKEISRIIKKIYTNRNTLNWASELFYKNTIENISSLAESFSYSTLKKELPHNIPAIIVASGPSLKKNIQYLREAKGRSFIIAVDSVLRTLDKEGIVPDIYISVDPGKNAGYFEIDALGNIPAVGSIESPSHMYRDGQIKFITPESEEYIQLFFDENNKHEEVFNLMAGGSVATSGFLFACMMGYSTIILVGQDLAYTDNRTHVHLEEFEVDDVKNGLMTAIDIYGNEVKTSYQHEFYRKWFEDMISGNPKIRVIDATEGGAYIKGTEIRTLKWVIDNLCTKEVDIQKCIGRCKKLFNNEEKDKFYEWMNKIPSNMKSIMNTAEEVSANYNEMITLAKKHKFNEVMNLYAHNNELCEKMEKDPIYYFVKLLNVKQAQNIEKRINVIEDDDVNDIIDISTLGKLYAEGVIKASKDVIKDYETLYLNKGNN